MRQHGDELVCLVKDKFGREARLGFDEDEL
jgi:hypothetical protein